MFTYLLVALADDPPVALPAPAVAHTSEAHQVLADTINTAQHLDHNN
ncbi:hypothetical protein [Streptomyces flavofungini]|nr:hypothetical protein [Streptomyces flavofungini]WJV51701.1 hypothetical protein QUY26_40285 [Streptomyces flavofungini]